MIQITSKEISLVTWLQNISGDSKDKRWNTGACECCSKLLLSCKLSKEIRQGFCNILHFSMEVFGTCDGLVQSTRANKIDLCLYGLKDVSKITNSVVSMKKLYTSTVILLWNIKSHSCCDISLLNYMHPCQRSIYSWSDNKWLAIKWILWFLPCCQLMIVGLKQNRDSCGTVWSLQLRVVQKGRKMLLFILASYSSWSELA